MAAEFAMRQIGDSPLGNLGKGLFLTGACASGMRRQKESVYFAVSTSALGDSQLLGHSVRAVIVANGLLEDELNGRVRGGLIGYERGRTKRKQ
jgi:hypothetical protein